VRAPATLLAAALLAAAPHAFAKGPAAAPPFRNQNPADWVGTPVTWAALRGKVVLIDVWTFG
jgi:hypothetical protein